MASLLAVTAPTPNSPEPTPASGDRRRGAARSLRRRSGARSSGRRRAVQLAGLVAGALLLGGCKLPTFYTFRSATGQERDTFTLYSATFIAAIVVGLITGGLILFAVFRYRRRSDAMPRQFQYHIPLEIFYTVVPVIIVLVLFGFTVTTENTVDTVPAHPVEKIEITAFQWGWKFDYLYQHRYVEGVRTENPDPVGLNGRTCAASAPNANWCLGPGLVMPVGETVDITLVSNDVVHSFLVPQFLFSRMALPGVRNHFAFTVRRAGIYRGQCNNFCGLYHAQMFFHVVALPPAQFAAWVHGPQTISDYSAGPIPTGPQSAAQVPGINPGGPSSPAGNTNGAGVRNGAPTPIGSVPASTPTGSQVGLGSGGNSSTSRSSTGATGSSSGGG